MWLIGFYSDEDLNVSSSYKTRISELDDEIRQLKQLKYRMDLHIDTYGEHSYAASKMHEYKSTAAAIRNNISGPGFSYLGTIPDKLYKYGTNVADAGYLYAKLVSNSDDVITKIDTLIDQVKSEKSEVEAKRNEARDKGYQAKKDKEAKKDGK